MSTISKEESNDQELKQSSTTPNPEHHMGKAIRCTVLKYSKVSVLDIATILDS